MNHKIRKIHFFLETYNKLLKMCMNLDWQITEDMMCAGVLEGGKGVGKGDSGGPLITKNMIVSYYKSSLKQVQTIH